MNEYLIETNNMNGGLQKVYKFENGYGASVIRHKGSYGYQKGLWEVAPWDEDRQFIGMTYMEWSDDVKGHLNDPEVDRILRQIKNL
tara:strand:+ start:787 stop:1044 length:258 start_codon:yes stop_codon:yes gene_type:complete